MKQDFFIGKYSSEIVNRAKKFGFNRVFFVKEFSLAKEKRKFDSYDAALIKVTSSDALRSMVDKASNFFSLVLVLGTTDVINRTALEHRKVHALVSPEYNRGHDYIHYRNSGLNQVLCKIARDNDKAIIISFRDILLSRGTERAILLGRIAQNIKLCRKYDVKLRIANFASKQEEMRDIISLKALGLTLGMSTAQAAVCCSDF